MDAMDISSLADIASQSDGKEQTSMPISKREMGASDDTKSVA